MEITNKFTYEAPETSAIEVKTEGAICNLSDYNQEDPQNW